jgi:hypothetical protein
LSKTDDCLWKEDKGVINDFLTFCGLKTGAAIVAAVKLDPTAALLDAVSRPASDGV